MVICKLRLGYDEYKTYIDRLFANISDIRVAIKLNNALYGIEEISEHKQQLLNVINKIMSHYKLYITPIKSTFMKIYKLDKRAFGRYTSPLITNVIYLLTPIKFENIY